MEIIRLQLRARFHRETKHRPGSYTSGDLSFNTKYNFTLTPYNAGGAGIARSITIDTTPKVTGVKATYSNAANTQLQWSGAYSYVKVSRAYGAGSSGAVGAYTDISTVVLSQPYLSGNTTYNYYITPYSSGGVASVASSAISLYTSVMAATDLSAIFYDLSAIKISFTAPTKNNYSRTSCYYTISATNGTTGYITSVSGSLSPLMVQNLSDGTIYTCYIMTTLDSLYTGTSSGLSVTTSSGAPQILSNVVPITYIGTDMNTYYLYAFTNTSTATNYFNIKYSGGYTLNCLVIGGGGGSFSNGGYHSGGGGAGGFIQSAISLSTSYTADSCSIVVGSGGVGKNYGGNSSISFANNILNNSNLVAVGGGYGIGGPTYAYAGTGGSGGGGGRVAYGGSGTSGQGNSGGSNGNLGNKGGDGGGGAGTAGAGGGVSPNIFGGAGGTGKYWSLNNSINPPNWYFAGGGGGYGWVSYGGAGGRSGGGGGGGVPSSSYSVGTGSSGGINNANNGGNGTIGGTGGGGGTNTGGGAGGCNNSSSSGGSGIVIISVQY